LSTKEECDSLHVRPHVAHAPPKPFADGTPKKRIKVRCTLEVEVEVPANDDDFVRFQIEENGCPGTGAVGSAIDREIERGEELSVCWACNLRGENKIVSLEPIAEAS
jgi:hypothetical protein